jgi:hypothetical protein
MAMSPAAKLRVDPCTECAAAHPLPPAAGAIHKRLPCAACNDRLILYEKTAVYNTCFHAKEYIFSKAEGSVATLR